MKTKLLKLALCAMAALPIGAWADSDRTTYSTDGETVISETTTWVFNSHTAGEIKTITSPLSDGLYVRANNSNTWTIESATGSATFSDGTTVSYTQIASSSGANSNQGSNVYSAAYTGAGRFYCTLAINTSVAGTCYAIMSGTSEKHGRVQFTDGTVLKSEEGEFTGDGNLIEVKYTSTGAGTFFIGGKLGEAGCKVYAVRFVPTEQTVSAATSLTFDHFATDANLESVYNMANGFFIRGNGSKYFTVKENEDASKPYSFSDGASLQANKYVKLNSAIEAHAFNNDNDQYPWTTTGGKTCPSIAFKNTVAGKILVYAAKASASTATLRYYTKSTGVTSTNQAVTTTPTEYSWNVAADEVTYITAGTAAGLHIYGVRFVPVIKTTIGSHGKSSFSCAQGLDFSNATPDGLKAYKAKEVNGDGLVVLLSVDEAPAGTGLILLGEPDTEYTIPVKDNATGVGDNLMVGTITETAVAASTSSVHNYIWAYTASGLGFYNVDAATTSAAGKAYLSTGATALAADPGARSFIFEDEDVTGIDVVKGFELKANGEYFNLSGQRVAQPTRGLYIVNGKKVVIK